MDTYRSDEREIRSFHDCQYMGINVSYIPYQIEFNHVYSQRLSQKSIIVLVMFDNCLCFLFQTVRECQSAGRHSRPNQTHQTSRQSEICKKATAVRSNFLSSVSPINPSAQMLDEQLYMGRDCYYIANLWRSSTTTNQHIIIIRKFN